MRPHITLQNACARKFCWTVCLSVGVASFGIAKPLEQGIFRIEADFRGENPPLRANRDIPFACDLSDADGLAFDLRVDDLSQFSYFSFYFWFADGSYLSSGFLPTQEGAWTRMTVRRPADDGGKDWRNLRGFRLSGWRGGTNETFLGVRDIAVVPKRPSPTPTEAESRARAASISNENATALARLATMPPRANERRFVWAHDPRGLKGRSWEQTVHFLRDCGYTDVIVNLVRGPTSAYPSDVLVYSEIAEGRDQLAESLAACRKYGLKLHAWTICWRSGWRTTDEAKRPFEIEDRRQRSRDGRLSEWLCPTYPENRRMLVDAMLELSAKGVDGVHFDFIRYPDSEYCFCPRCRDLFARWSGEPLAAGLASTYASERQKSLWRKFRCAAITAPMKKVSETLRANPSNRCEISAAVFCDPLSDPDSVGQDWGAWCHAGLLDFVCPMTYEDDFGWFKRKLDKEARQVSGRVPQYPGIGLGVWPRDGREVARFCEQVRYVRETGRGGFAVFDLNWKLEQLMPSVGAALGVAKPCQRQER